MQYDLLNKKVFTFIFMLNIEILHENPVNFGQFLIFFTGHLLNVSDVLLKRRPMIITEIFYCDTP